MRAALWGFVRTVQTEQPQWRVSLVDCDEAPSRSVAIDELFAADVEPEVGIGAAMAATFVGCGNSSHASVATCAPVARPRTHSRSSRSAASIRSSSAASARTAPAAGEVEVEVAAAGLNFRDVMKALGIYPLGAEEPVTFGDEFSGRIVRVGRGVRKLRAGDRVMGFAPAGGAFASHLVLSADAVWKVPAHLGLAEAASIPVVFGTAYHALA